MTGTPADKFIETITPLLHLWQAFRVSGMALYNNGQWFNLGIRVQLQENPATSRDIQSPDQRFMYYMLDYPLESLSHVVGQLSNGNAFTVEKDHGTGGAFAEISLKPVRSESGLSVNWYPPMKREPTPEQRKSGVRRSSIALVSSGQMIQEVLDQAFRIKLDSKLRIADPPHDGLPGLAKLLFPGTGFENWQQTLVEMIAELPFEIESTNAGKFTIRASTRAQDGLLSTTCFYQPQAGIKPVRLILRRDEAALPHPTLLQWDRNVDWPKRTESAKITLFYQEEEVQSVQVMRNIEPKADMADSRHAQSRSQPSVKELEADEVDEDVAASHQAPSDHRLEPVRVAQRLAVRLTVEGPSGNFEAMASLVSKSLAVTTFRVIKDSGASNGRPRILAHPCWSNKEQPITASLLGWDEEADFAVFQLSTEVEFEMEKPRRGVDFAHDFPWESCSVIPTSDKLRFASGIIPDAGTVLVGGHTYLPITVTKGFPFEDVPWGSPIVAAGALIGIFASINEKNPREWYAVRIDEMIASRKTSLVRDLFPRHPAEPPITSATGESSDQERIEGASPEDKEGEEAAVANSIYLSSISDAPNPDDALGFKPYVHAIARFLLSDNTEPPLTLSVEGEWGSGKSSFLLQLKDAVTGDGWWERFKKTPVGKYFATKHSSKRKPGKRVIEKPVENLTMNEVIRQRRRFSVEFNPWRHDKEDSLWATFALEFLRQVSRQRMPLRRWYGHAQLFAAHYWWRKGWFEALRAVVVWLLMFSLVASFFVVLVRKPRWAEAMIHSLTEKMNGPPREKAGPKYQELIYFVENTPSEGEGGKPRDKSETGFDPLVRMLLLIGGNAAYFAVVLTIWLRVKDIVGNPLEINLKQYLRAPDYEGRVAFVEQFHEDFKKIVNAYAGDKKVFVFIDDLDRCEVPKAAELMKAVNLLIADDPRLIFILGMDRDKVAAGLAVKYEKMLPYLIPGKPEADRDVEWKRKGGLEFGHAFLQKFIQLPFRVPEPNPENYLEFIKTISVPVKSVAKAIPNKTHKTAEPILNPTPSETVVNQNATIRAEKTDANPVETSAKMPDVTAPTEKQVKERREREFTFDGDSQQILDTSLMYARTLGPNPRRLKQFMNLLRLQAYIVNEIGFFDPQQEGTTAITIGQLGKFIAIGLKWPGLLADFAANPQLLAKLEDFATSPDSRYGDQPTVAEQRWLSEPRMKEFLIYGLVGDQKEFTLNNSLLHQLLHICPQRIKTLPLTKPNAL
jgi:KAP family P-loop domain